MSPNYRGHAFKLTWMHFRTLDEMAGATDTAPGELLTTAWRYRKMGVRLPVKPDECEFKVEKWRITPKRMRIKSSPMELFSQIWDSSLTVEEIAAIFEESVLQVRERAEYLRDAGVPMADK